MTHNRKNCPMRHENGNCTVIGGFCTSVNDEICEGLHNAFKSGQIHREKRCGTCKHCYEGHYENKGEKPYIKRKCTNKYGLNNGYSIYENDFCSRWEATE